jgi:predicted NBD/HSP70 family sugar kinase
MDMTGTLQKALGTPVIVDNDANLGALGEARRGAGRGCSDFVYVKLAHGLGAGLVLGSRLYVGGLSAAGEIGHTSINENGPLCSCGGRGCLELYAGGRAIARALVELNGSRPSLREIIERCNAGEPAFVRAVSDAGAHLGFALANVANLLAPTRIILGGELSQVGPVLADAVRQAVHRGSERTLTHPVEVTVAALGDRAELLGAVELGVGRLRNTLGIPATDQLLGHNGSLMQVE